MILDLEAYLHRSPGQPGVDAGTGWGHFVQLTFSNATVWSNCETLPVAILDGDLTLGETTLRNVFEVPYTHTGPCGISISLVNGTRLEIQGTALQVALIGYPTFIEHFQS